MKKYNFTLLLLATLFISCQDYLDVVPDNIATIDHAFANRNAAEKYLYTCYSYLQQPGNRNSDPAFLSGDEITLGTGYQNLPGRRISKGFQNTQSPHFNFWSSRSLYGGIRNCNVFLEKIKEVRDIEDFEREYWIGEVKFLKAYYHFYLLRMYGPIIINEVNVPVSSVDKDLIAPERYAVDETFDYIVTLLDEAIEGLPLRLQSLDEYGRVTKVIASSIKAKILATAASPLFNGNPIYSSFLNSKGEPFFSTSYDETKWTRAVDACRDAIALCDSIGLRLYTKDDYIKVQNQSDTILLRAGLRGRVTDEWNPELIWGSVANTSGIQNQSMQRLFRHKRNATRPSNSVTMRIAELYYSKNGVPIEEDNSWNFSNRFRLRTATDADKYFVEPSQTTVNLHYDREPRFYADLSFDRGTWFGNGRENTDEFWYVHGRDQEPGGFTEQRQYTVTGYNPKKLVNIKSTVNSEGTSFSARRYPFPYMRLADLYLLYAEVLNESKGSPDGEVYEYLDRIRTRAGLMGVVESWATFSSNPSKPMTKEGMRDIIQQERLIELTFEGHRFWDLRRWKLAKDLMNKPIRGWNIPGEGSEPEVYYQIQNLDIDKFSRFEEKDYLWPIPLSEIVRTPSLQQNPGW